MRIVFILWLLLCTGAFSGLAQESWKDSVRTKQKVTKAFYADSVIYFQTKKGWGIYDRNQQKVLVQPVYQFVKLIRDGQLPGIYFVQNNKVGLMDVQGKIQEQAVYNRLGYALIDENHFVIKDWQMTGRSSSAKLHYRQLGQFTEYSVAVNAGKVLINLYRQTYPAPLYRVLPDGTAVDSVDAGGNQIYLDPEPYNRSMVVDIETGEQLVRESEAARVGYCLNNILLRKEMTRDHHLINVYSVIDGKDKTVYRLTGVNDRVNDKKSIARILSGYEPGFVYSNDSTDLYDVFVFESNGKYGVYDQIGFRVLLEPVEYEFIYVPHRSSTAFTVKNGKVGMFDLDSGKTLHDNLYQQLTVHHLRGDTWSQDYISCDETGIEKNGPDTVSILLNNEQLDLALRAPHGITGLGTDAGKMVIHDYETPSESTDVLLNEYGEVYAEKPFYPGHCMSGVFDPAAFKWTVPKKYTLIRNYENGYACALQCDQKNLYTFYSRQGKVLFENMPVDSVKTKDNVLRQLMNFNGQGQLHTTWLPPVFYGHDRKSSTCVTGAGGRWGIFDLDHLNWLVPPVYQFINYNSLTGNYTVCDSGKIGIMHSNYNMVVPAEYGSIDLLDNHDYFCANDTFLYATGTLRLAAVTDTMNLEKLRSNNAWGRHNLHVRIDQNKLYTEEGYTDPVYGVADEMGNRQNVGLDTSASHVVDMVSAERVWFRKGWILRELEQGYITEDVRGVCRAYDASGGNMVQLYEKDSAGCNGKWFWYWETDERFYYDLQGNIIRPGQVESVYFMHRYHPAGYDYHYFDGKTFLKGPEGFKVMCANRNGLLLGYEVQADDRTNTNHKRYRYYDTGTGKYGDVQLELPDSPVKVYPVKDGFVLFGYDYKEKHYNCLVLENDLKTVKSGFKKLKGYRAERSFRTIDPVPYYELHTEKKIVYFDRNFQFLHECNYQDRLLSSIRFNRIVLRSKFKTIVMDWKGRLLRQ